MRNDFTGMIPAAIEKFEALFDALEAKGLKPQVTSQYSAHGGDDDLRTWGVVCGMACSDPAALATEAAKLKINIQPDGSLAFLESEVEGKKLTIADFKTLEIGGDMKRVAKIAVKAEKI